jgi:hypothetical protein
MISYDDYSTIDIRGIVGDQPTKSSTGRLLEFSLTILGIRVVGVDTATIIAHIAFVYWAQHGSHLKCTNP